MLDFLGHVGYVLILAGMVLISRRSAVGWFLRLLGEVTWLGIGVAMDMSSMVVWGAVFTALDGYSWVTWTRTERARKLSEECSTETEEDAR
jgi:nicotinamide riboside transporter PnuC